jgi:hypothetical protein
MKVYIVIYDMYEYSTNVGVYSNRVEAEKLAEHLGKDYDVEEHELDASRDCTEGLTHYWVDLALNGDFHTSEEWRPTLDNWMEIVPYYNNPWYDLRTNPLFRGEIWAESAIDAVKVLQEFATNTINNMTKEEIDYLKQYAPKIDPKNAEPKDEKPN